MPVLFRSKPGSVVRLDDPAAQCTTRLLRLSPGIGFDAERSIVTRVTLSQQVNVQFLHTLGAHVFIYVFGDRMGQLGLSGLSFQCGGTMGQGCDDGVLGAEKMLLWYKRNRASKRRGPVQVMIGNETIEGFVVGFNEDVVDPSLQLVQWGVTMNVLPEV